MWERVGVGLVVITLPSGRDTWPTPARFSCSLWDGRDSFPDHRASGRISGRGDTLHRSFLPPGGVARSVRGRSQASSLTVLSHLPAGAERRPEWRAKAEPWAKSRRDDRK